ncbi:MAG TPA: TldD/PmbA family protein [bacterium]|nr:TldD/PmbA family protein [bacterium]
MPHCEPSAYLRQVTPRLREALARLGKRYTYISVLGTDSFGITYAATPGERTAGDSNWVERGFVFRAQRDGCIVEHALNELPEGDLASVLAAAIDPLFHGLAGARRYPAIPDEPLSAERFGSFDIDPFTADPDRALDGLSSARAAAQAASPEIVFASARLESMRVSKIFLSPNRELTQAFIWSQAYLVAVGRRGDVSKENYQPVSGLAGLEILGQLEHIAPAFGAETLELLDAGRIEPGEYDVIMDPDVAGTLAHEAFGHGVETDMFVKGRAKATEYLGKPVASPIVQMYDGAAGVDQCGSFLFDDEGRLATRTQIIRDGVLVSGISDLQSALMLGFVPTGNGRRQAYDHKAYARMTNTYFSPGDSTYLEMLSSVRHGWLLQKLNSGMEDPKNWGVQLVVLIGREIVDGRLTGRIVSPVVCSGYVPDVLSNITMLSDDFELFGSGYCGKGYKEFVKVSCGGPYVKTKMRLG